MELSSLLALPHADLVTQLAYSPSSTHLLSASSDASLAVYRRSSDGVFSKVEQWKAHDGPVGGVGWAGDEWGVVCASWGWDRRVCVWREDPDEKRNSSRRFPLVWSTLLPPSLGTPQSLSFPPTSSSSSLLLSVLTSSGALVVYSPAGNGLNDWFQLVNVNLPRLLENPSSSSGEATGGLAKGLVGAAGGKGDKGIKRLTWCKELWWGLVFAVSLDPSGTISIFSLANPSAPPNLLLSLPSPSTAKQSPSSPRTLTSLSWAPSCGRSYHLVASGDRTGTIRIWRVVPSGVEEEEEGEEGQERGEWSARCVAELVDHGASITQLQWNVTGTILSSSADDGKTRLWKATYANRWECAAVFDAETPAENEGDEDMA